MPPKPPPARKARGHYHYHVWDYAGSAPFTASGARATPRGQQLYSLYQDLRGLRDYGKSAGVPNIALSHVGPELLPPQAGARGGDARPYVTVLSMGSQDPAAPRVLITGGMHAREWIGAEVAYLIAEYLVVNYQAQPSPGKQTTIKQLVSSRQIHIAPVLNPLGNLYTAFSPEQNAREWRKNRRPLPITPTEWEMKITHEAPGAQGRQANPPFTGVRLNRQKGELQYTVPVYPAPGLPVPVNPGQTATTELANKQVGVDLDRNFPTSFWGYETLGKDGTYKRQLDPKSDTYFGPKALSEAESASIQAYAASLPAKPLAIDFHSYGRIILFPGEYDDAGRVDEDYYRMGRVLQDLTADPDGKLYALGGPLERVGYSATGTIDAYLAQSRAARAFSIELDGASFSLPETEIQAVFETNIRGVLAAISAGHLGQSQMSAARDEFAQWKVSGCGNQLPA
jgi:hypothetical protein